MGSLNFFFTICCLFHSNRFDRLLYPQWSSFCESEDVRTVRLSSNSTSPRWTVLRAEQHTHFLWNRNAVPKFLVLTGPSCNVSIRVECNGVPPGSREKMSWGFSMIHFHSAELKGTKNAIFDSKTESFRYYFGAATWDCNSFHVILLSLLTWYF